MVRLFSTRSCSSYVCLFLIVNIVLFMFYPIVREISEETSEQLNGLYIRSPLDKYSGESILRYFQWKEQRMKQSPFKVIK